MKKLLIVIVALVVLSLVRAHAQYVRVKPGFSVGVTVGAPGPAPYPGAIWIGPEWKLKGGRYTEVAGYRERPRRHHGWIPGHWKYTRRGYRWVSGHWR